MATRSRSACPVTGSPSSLPSETEHPPDRGSNRPTPPRHAPCECLQTRCNLLLTESCRVRYQNGIPRYVQVCLDNITSRSCHIGHYRYIPFGEPIKEGRLTNIRGPIMAIRRPSRGAPLVRHQPNERKLMPQDHTPAAEFRTKPLEADPRPENRPAPRYVQAPAACDAANPDTQYQRTPALTLSLTALCFRFRIHQISDAFSRCEIHFPIEHRSPGEFTRLCNPVSRLISRARIIAACTARPPCIWYSTISSPVKLAGPGKARTRPSSIAPSPLETVTRTAFRGSTPSRPVRRFNPLNAAGPETRKWISLRAPKPWQAHKSSLPLIRSSRYTLLLQAALDLMNQPSLALKIIKRQPWIPFHA